MEFSYTGLSFLAPARITFRYMLEGFDKNWIDAGTRREAFYTNLPPGTFRFRVTACNVRRRLQRSGQRRGFHAGSRITISGSGFCRCRGADRALASWLAYQLRIRRLREQFNLILAERSRIARELHDTLIQGFSGITMEMQALAARLRVARGTRARSTTSFRTPANCLRETRRSRRGLAQRANRDLGSWRPAIEQAARQITETKDVRLKLKLEKRLDRSCPPTWNTTCCASRRKRCRIR